MKSRVELWCVVGLMLASGGACAEGICPPGQYPVGDARAPGCAPIPNYGGSSGQQEIPARPPRSTGEWIKTWGAMAANDKGDGGVAIGKLTKKQAEDEAVQQCLTWGGGGCKPTLVYQNQCAAIASLDNPNALSMSASASSPELAKEVALQACSKANGGAICKVVYSACSDPIFRRY